MVDVLFQLHIPVFHDHHADSNLFFWHIIKLMMLYFDSHIVHNQDTHCLMDLFYIGSNQHITVQIFHISIRQLHSKK